MMQKIESRQLSIYGEGKRIGGQTGLNDRLIAVMGTWKSFLDKASLAEL